jgi:hypothetical protein
MWPAFLANFHICLPGRLAGWRNRKKYLPHACQFAIMTSAEAADSRVQVPALMNYGSRGVRTLPYYPGHYLFNLNYSIIRRIANVLFMEKPLHNRRLFLSSLQMTSNLADQLTLSTRPILFHRLLRILIQALVRV